MHHQVHSSENQYLRQKLRELRTNLTINNTDWVTGLHTKEVKTKFLIKIYTNLCLIAF